MVCNGQSTQVRALTDRYREEWESAGNAARDIPIIGMNRHIVIAETEAEAVKASRAGYASWFHSFVLLWKRKGIPVPQASYTDDYDEAVRRGFIIAGTPRMVREPSTGWNTCTTPSSARSCRARFSCLAFMASSIRTRRNSSGAKLGMPWNFSVSPSLKVSPTRIVP